VRNRTETEPKMKSWNRNNTSFKLNKKPLTAYYSTKIAFIQYLLLVVVVV